MMKSTLRSFACGSLLLLAFVSVAPAQTNIRLFRGGENDPGATNGGSLLNSTVDFTGTANLTLSGNGLSTYTSSTPVGGSSLAYNFTDGATYAGGAIPTLTSSASFAMELWINPSSLSGGQVLFHNGNTSTLGLGLFLNGSDVTVLQAGQSVTNINAVTSGTWNHFALVVDNGTLKGYFNGTQTLSIPATFNAPTLESGSLFLGGNNGTEQFNGIIDEARIFTFSTGTFNASMLNYSAVPEPSTYAAIFGACALGLAVWRRRVARGSRSPALLSSASLSDARPPCA